MIYKITNDYRYYTILGIIYFCIFAYNIEYARDFTTWLWLLAAILNFMSAIKNVIIVDKKIHTDGEIVAISEYIKIFAVHTDMVNAQYAAIEKFGEEKTKRAVEFLNNKAYYTK